MEKDKKIFLEYVNLFNDYFKRAEIEGMDMAVGHLASIARDHELESIEQINKPMTKEIKPIDEEFNIEKKQKIVIQPSPRIDYCGDCHKEHGCDQCSSANEIVGEKCNCTNWDSMNLPDGHKPFCSKKKCNIDNLENCKCKPSCWAKDSIENWSQEFDKKFITKQSNPMGNELINSPNIVQDSEPIKSFIRQTLATSQQDLVERIESEIEEIDSKEDIFKKYGDDGVQGYEIALATFKEILRKMR